MRSVAALSETSQRSEDFDTQRYLYTSLEIQRVVLDQTTLRGNELDW